MHFYLSTLTRNTDRISNFNKTPVGHLMKFLHVLCLLLFVAVKGLVAQEIDEQHFTCYTEKQGLSGNNITGLAQDATGYIWISTTAGLNRFNGSNFVQFHSNNDSLSIPSEHLTGMAWIDQYRLGIWTKGLHIINTRTGETRNLFVPYSNKRYQYKFNTILSVQGNDKGDIILNSRSGMYHFDRNNKLVYRFDYYTKEEVPVTEFGFGRKLYWLGNNALLFATTFGVYYYNLAKRQCKKMEAADCPLIQEILRYPDLPIEFFQTKPDRLFIVNQDTDSLYYFDFTKNIRMASPLPAKTAAAFDWRSRLVAVSDTLLYITGNLAGFYKLRLYPETGRIHFYPKKYFPFHYCRSVMKDRDNLLWVGTNKGLFRQDNSRRYVQYVQPPEHLQSEFPNTTIDDIYAGRKKVYVATYGYAGLLVYDKQLNFLERISFEKYFRNPNYIQAVIPANDTVLYVGTNGPLFTVNTQTNRITEIPLDKFTRQFDWIADIYKDRRQNVWVTTDSIYRYDTARRRFSLILWNSNPFNKIQKPNTIGEDTAGNIWIAGHGLIRYNIRSNTFDHLIDSFPYIQMPDRSVVSFAVDPQNNIWLNSNNNGLICYNADRKTFRHFTRDDGLPDNNIATMIIVGNKLWMACHAGIACLDLRTHIITSFGEEDGFPVGSITNGVKFSYDTAQNKLYIGFRNTIVRFDPGIIEQNNQAPHIFIESLTTGDQHKYLFPEKNFTSSWRNNEITIAIGCINFINGNSQRFAYRLMKADSSRWQQLGTWNTFSISNLAPGKYRVQVKVYSINNRWPAQIKEIGITILPPFWKQPWFTTICILLLPLLVLMLLKWRIGVIRKKESINKQLAEAQLLALQTQMNPHFIFNSLNSIKGMVLDNQQQKASRYLSKFARIIRITVNQSKQIFTTLYENIEYLESYLLMETLRFGDSFNFRITVDKHIDKEDILIPTMMIQPLVENAIWHGLMQKLGEKTVTIHFSRDNDTLSCIIEDNGIGIHCSEKLKRVNKPPYQSVGLNNLRNRIKILNEKYDTGCSLIIFDLGDANTNKTGTRAVLHFNIMYKNCNYESNSG
jgi:ligand-binding sensor domain-containing protein